MSDGAGSEASAEAASGAASRRIDEGLLAAYYDEFRRLARRALRGGAVTLQPTELAHEAAMRLLGREAVIVDEAHFLALAARVIRATLIDEVRRRGAAKRDVGLVTRWRDEHDARGPAPDGPIDIARMDELLSDLARVDEALATLVELRFYAGLTMAEIAREHGISESTALRRWRVARAWLLRELAEA